MAEFTYNPIQLVEPGAAAILQPSNTWPNNFIQYLSETGLVILRGPSMCGNMARFARYFIIAGSNIAVPTDGTIGEISQALALDGTAIQPSRARATVAAVEQYENVTSFRQIDVPAGCCYAFSVQNTSDQAINMQNLNVSVTRTA